MDATKLNARLDTGFPTASVDLPEPALSKATFSARAVYVGEHIDLRPFVRTKRFPAQQPAVIAFDSGGIAMLFRYGAVVFFDVLLPDQQHYLSRLSPFIRQPYEQPESEELRIAISDKNAEVVAGETVSLKDASAERLQVVAAVLSKSVALAQYEADVAQNFERIEPFAVQLEKSGRGGRNMRQLLRHIGRALLDELKMVARVEVTDRPDLIWDHPGLSQLYRQLEDEFELQERAAILDRKLDLVSRTVGTVLDLLQKSRGMRVEWYIVVLIVLELVLTLYQIFVQKA